MKLWYRIMRSSFNYFYTTTAEDCIDIEDIGNVCIQASNDTGQNWILLIRTKLGFSYILEYGPFFYGKITEYLSHTFQRIEYSEYKLEKKINKFLNEPKRVITQVQIRDEEEALELMTNVVEVMNESYQ